MSDKKKKMSTPKKIAIGAAIFLGIGGISSHFDKNKPDMTEAELAAAREQQKEEIIRQAQERKATELELENAKIAEEQKILEELSEKREKAQKEAEEKALNIAEQTEPDDIPKEELKWTVSDNVSKEESKKEITQEIGTEEDEEHDYILNTSTMKFHRVSCSSIEDMKEENKENYHGKKEDIIEKGYEPCGKCKP